MPRLRVAFIGAGHIADRRILGYSNCPDAEFGAVCALNEAAARRWAEGRGIAHWTTDAGSPLTSADAPHSYRRQRNQEELAGRSRHPRRRRGGALRCVAA
jgi:predicted dehydrogenase